MSLTDVLRKTINQADTSIYRIAKDSGVDWTIVDRFRKGERDMALSTADRLAAYFRLELKSKAKPKRRRKRRGV